MNRYTFSFLLFLSLMTSSLFAQKLDINLNGTTNNIKAISQAVFCLENGDKLTFSYPKAEEGKKYILQGIVVYGQIKLGTPQALKTIPQVELPYTATLAELIPPSTIPNFSQGSTKIAIAVQQILQVEGNRVKEIIPLSSDDGLKLGVVSGCPQD
ncbi:MAG: hypothetical protein AAFY71_09735 [Bacteroidota bacterium]